MAYHKLTTAGMPLQDYRGNALHLACYLGDAESVSLILSYRKEWANPSWSDILHTPMQAKQYPLHLAVRMDSESIATCVGRIISSASFFANAPVQPSIVGDHVGVVAALYDAGVEDMKDCDEKFALYYAARDGKAEMVKKMALASRVRQDPWNQALAGYVQQMVARITEIDGNGGSDSELQRSNLLQLENSALALHCLLDPSHVTNCDLVYFSQQTSDLSHAFYSSSKYVRHMSQSMEVLQYMKQLLKLKTYDELLWNMDKRTALVNGIIVVATLFVTVTFSPLSNPNSSLTGTVLQKVFYFFNNFSYIFAIATIITGIFLLMPFSQGYTRRNTIRLINAHLYLLLLTIASGICTFVLYYIFLPKAFETLSFVIVGLGALLYSTPLVLKLLEI